MSWLGWLLLAALVAVFAAVTGIKPRNTRHVAHTNLMGVARVVLFVVVAILIYMYVRAR
jgi:hypothetical protein